MPVLQPRGSDGRLNEEEGWKIIIHRKNGHSLKSISREHNVNIKTVGNTLKRYQETDGMKDRSGTGRKQKLTTREMRWIVLQAKVNRRITSPRIKEGLKLLCGKSGNMCYQESTSTG